MRILIVVLVVIGVAAGDEAEMDKRQMEMLVRTYPSFLVRKREEQKQFIQRMLAEEDYEKKYKMFSMAFENILQMLEVEQKSIATMKHVQDTLPDTPKEFKAVVTVLEHICIMGEVVLHFPPIAYRVLDKLPGWRAKLEFAGEIVGHYRKIFDEKTLEMLHLFDQEINPEKRSEDYVNPYAEKEEESAKEKKKKKKKSLKKGPALQEL